MNLNSISNQHSQWIINGGSPTALSGLLSIPGLEQPMEFVRGITMIEGCSFHFPVYGFLRATYWELRKTGP